MSRIPPLLPALLEELEPRLLLSADAQPLLLDPTLLAPETETPPLLEADPGQRDAAALGRTELVFVDAAAPDATRLVEELRSASGDDRSLEVFLLDAGRDGLTQIGEVLAGYEGVDAVHVISHGTAGAVQLGSTWLRAGNLEAFEDVLRGWGGALSAEADLLFYGCDLAAGAEGQALVARLAELTGADVAASIDATGAAALGGDWELEHTSGSVETALAFDAQAQAAFDGVLDGTAIWTEKTNATPQTSDFAGIGFGAESNTANVNGQWRILAGAEAPTRDEKIVVGVYENGATDALSGMLYDGASWSAFSFNDFAGVGDSFWWGFAVGYESQSGDAMLVYNNGSTGTAGLSYRTWDGATWSGPTAITTPLAGEPEQMRIATHPDSDEMVLVVSNDSSQDYALVWDGDAWGNAQILDSGSGDDRTDVYVAYEQQSGEALVTFAKGGTDVSYRTWDGATWSGEGTLSAPGGVTDYARWTTLGADFGSDRIALGVRSNANEDWLAVWDGDAWGSVFLANTGETATPNFHGVAVAFESNSGQALAAYSDDNNKIRFRTWSSGSGWSAESDGPDLGGKVRTLTLDARPLSDQIMLMGSDASEDVHAALWDGASFGSKADLENDTNELKNQPFLFLWDRDTAAEAAGVNTPFWLSTAGDVTNGASGIVSWTEGEALSFGDPDLELEPVSGTTSGTFAHAFNLDAFGGDTDIDAIHYVTRDITVGSANAVDLFEGDLLLSTQANENLTSLNTLAVQNKDVFVFRPATPGDYSSGTFIMLLDDPTAGADIRGVSLVEKDTTVGDTTLSAGDFLVVTSGGAEDEDVRLFQTTDVGSGTTSGTLVTLLEGTDTNVSIAQQLHGIDLLEEAATIGGHALAAGTILLTTNGSDTVGSNNASVNQFDVFALDVTATTLVAGAGNGAATGTLIIDGSDVGLSSGGEEVNAITTLSLNQTPEVTLPGGGLAYTENDGAVVIDGTATASDPDDRDFDTGTLTVDFTANGSANDRLSIRNQGTGAGQVGVSGSDVSYEGTVVGTFAGGTDGSTPLVVTFDADADATAVQAVLRNVTYENVSEAPSTATRTVRVVLTDGDGGTSSEVTTTVSVTAVNDAPVLMPATPSLTAITEDDTGNAGQTVASILGGSVTDVDSGAVEGIAITGLTSSNGTWQYDTGSGFTDVGAVASNSALLLRATDSIRFVPDGANADAASFDFVAWDQTTGTAGTKVDPGAGGGTTAFSSVSDTASITVTAVNDAPVLTAAAPSLAAITEDDTGNAGQTVASILGASVTDVDSGALEGIAITGLTSSNGTWQYDTGSGFVDVGAVATNSALLLRATDSIRFVPDGLNGDAASFDFVAWDQNTGAAGTKVDPGAGGGTTAFSSASDTASITVTAVNDAPVLTPATPSLTTIAEDDTGNAGQTVASILGASVTDVDSGALEGIAITGLTSGNGTWQYDTGSGFTDVGAVASNSALLLRATDSIRFVPDGLNADAASFDFVAWDQTSGSAGTKVDPGAGGATTAFSSASDTASITVTALNDAPVLTPAAPSLTSITEDDTGNAGQTVASILGGSVTDVDSGAVEGIAITGLSGNGTWQYDTGSGWTDVGTVATNSALLLRATDSVRYVPDAENAETASFDLVAWDQTSGSAGSKVDPGTGGGTTAFSTASDTASITVTAVNDAPVLDNTGDMTLNNVVENDADPPGNKVSNIILSAAGDRVTDVDAGALEGFAVIGVDDTNGTWEYSTDDGSSWFAFGAVSNNSAVLLDASDRIRFVPDASYNGSAGDVTFRAWDQSTGSAGQTGVDVSTNGGTTAFSAATETATLTVIPVNDAPVLTPFAPTLTGLTEDQTNDGGQSVASIVGASITDIDGNPEGIAVTATSEVNGGWEFSTDGGGSWFGFGPVADDMALLLRDTDLVRFVPDGENGGSSSFSYRAWDQTTGTAGTHVDSSNNGGTTAFSTAIDTASISVSSLNDAPVLTPAAPSLTSITEDDTGNAGQTVASILGASVTDVDAGALEGIAITGLTSSNGTWQYDTGSGFTDVGAVASNSALLLRATDSIRFVPDGQNADAASFDFVAWDQTTGTAGTKVDPGAGGGTTAFSSASDTASITATAVNDAPVLTPAAPSLTSITEDDTGNAGQTVASILGASVTDVDSGALEGIAITGLTSSNGTWQYDTGSGFTDVGAVASNGALLLRATDSIRFVPDGQNADAASFDFVAWDQATGSAGTKVDPGAGGGTTAFSSASDTASIMVTALNDAPVLTPAAPSLTSITEDDTGNAGQTVASILGASVTDVDSGALEGIAITGLTSSNGTWQYDTGSGFTDVGAVAANSALLLRATDSIRFVPDGLNADAASFDFAAWDQTTGAAGTKVDPGAGGGTTAFSTAGDTASITVTAVNDAPSLTGFTTSLPENSPNGTVVGSVSAADPDNGETLSYAILAGNTGGAFAIDGAGQISVADSNALDFETTPSFALTVEVSDLAGATDTASVTLNLTGVNEAPSLVGASFTLVEGSAIGTKVGSVVATDPDAGDTVSYAITGGNTGGAFAIDAAGRITVADPGALDFDTNPSFTLSVEASDGGGLVGSASVSVTLTEAFTIPPGLDDELGTPPAPEPEPPTPEPAETAPADEPAPAPEAPSEAPAAPPPVPNAVAGLDASLLGGEEPAESTRSSSPRALAEDPDDPMLVPSSPRNPPEGAELDFDQPGTLQGGLDFAARQQLSQTLDRVSERMREQAAREEKETQTFVAAAQRVGLVASAGVIGLLLRGGSLVAAMLSSLPLWRRVDPLAVLGLSDEERRKWEKDLRSALEEEEDEGVGRVLDERETKQASQDEEEAERAPEVERAPEDENAARKTGSRS